MGKGKKKIPAVREGDIGIEIDQKKGEWPFCAFYRDRNGSGSLMVMVDANDAKIIGGGNGAAMVVISGKKARRLRDFLIRTDPEFEES